MTGAVPEPSRRRCVAVVLNWRDADRTIRCVEHLAGIPDLDEVVVVDNESDGVLGRSVEAAGFGRVTVIESPENRGFGGGVNLGIGHPSVWSADYVLMMNNDATIDGKDLRSLVDELQRQPEVGMVAPTVLNPDGSVQDRGGRLVPLLGLATATRRLGRAPAFLSWACVLLRGEAMRDIGLLDEQYFMYWEDVDYALRARRRGWALRVSPEAVARHERSVSRAKAGGLLKLYHSWGLAHTARKYRGPWLVGLAVWTLVSALSQATRLRLDVLRYHLHGVRRGWTVDVPAYTVVTTARH